MDRQLEAIRPETNTPHVCIPRRFDTQFSQAPAGWVTFCGVCLGVGFSIQTLSFAAWIFFPFGARSESERSLPSVAFFSRRSTTLSVFVVRQRQENSQLSLPSVAFFSRRSTSLSVLVVSQKEGSSRGGLLPNFFPFGVRCETETRKVAIIRPEPNTTLVCIPRRFATQFSQAAAGWVSFWGVCLGVGFSIQSLSFRFLIFFPFRCSL